MSDHRSYLEYIVSQDPRGKAEQLLRVRNTYRREGEISLPAPQQLSLNTTRPPMPPSGKAPPPLPIREASNIEEGLDSLAVDLVKEEDIAELRRRIAWMHERADKVAAQRFSRFEIFLSNRSTLRRLGRETPYWQPMLDELIRIWLAAAHRQETMRGELIARRLTLLSGEGQRKLFDALRLNVPDLVRQETYLFERLINPNQGSARPPSVIREPVSPLPNLNRSRRRDDHSGSGGFRWYHFIMIYFVIKIIYLVIKDVSQ